MVNTANPDRAAALYGARLGLRMALDRSNPDWDMRLIFFRIGGLTIELAHKISEGISEQARPALWSVVLGACPTSIAAHARLEKANLPITSIRAGRHPGNEGLFRPRRHR